MYRAVRINVSQCVYGMGRDDALTRGLDVSYLHDSLRTGALQTSRYPDGLRYARLLLQVRYPRVVKI